MAATAGSSGGTTKPGLVIDSHRKLAANRRKIIASVADDPQRLRLLAANPVQALRDAGITVTPEIANHILHAVQHPARVTTERERLVARLRKALRTEPKPTDPRWLASTVFDKLHVAPLATKGHDPTYLPLIEPEAEERLRALLPPRTRPRLPAQPTEAPDRPKVWRLDLDAPVPDLPAASRTPKTLSLYDLWFYRSAHALVPDLLRLGVIDASVLPVVTPAVYRRLKAGEQTSGLLAWINAVHFPQETPKKRT